QADSTVPRHSTAGLVRTRQRTTATQASVTATAARQASQDIWGSNPAVCLAMLPAILRGQPKCSATHPSQTVAAVSEKHMTANQSSVLTMPRRKVGSENAASTAHGTTSIMNSGSDGCTMAGSNSSVPSAKDS